MADPKDTKNAPEEVESAEEALDAKALKIERDRLAEEAKMLQERVDALQDLNKPAPKGAPAKGTPYALVHIIGKGRRDVKPGDKLLDEELKGLRCKGEYTDAERNHPAFHLAKPTFHYEMR